MTGHLRVLCPLGLLLTALVASTAGLGADEWPEFRGPTGQGHSDERGIPAVWSESQNIVWKVPVPGEGWSSPVVANGKVWLTSAAEDRSGGSLRVLAFDVATG